MISASSSSITFPTSEAVLPEEITKELEALSQIDDARKSRIERLEKLRRGEEDVLRGNSFEWNKLAHFV